MHRAVCAALLVVLPVVAANTYSDIVFATTFSDSQYGGRVISGESRLEKLGLRVSGNSRVEFDVSRKRRIVNGRILLVFYPPEIEPGLRPILSGKLDCFCAISVHMDRLVLEVSDQWIRIARLDDDYSGIDHDFARLDMDMRPDGREVELLLEVTDNRAVLKMNGRKMLECDVRVHDLSKLSVVTYQHAFTLSELTLTSLEPKPIAVDNEHHEIRIRAEYSPTGFLGESDLPHHHLAVWEKGPSGIHGLLRTFVSDSAVHAALQSIGARPGNSIPAAAWSKRNDLRASEPTVHASGSPLVLEIEYDGKNMPLENILTDTGSGRYRFRFSGNRENALKWNPGCIVCLQSCPAGVIGNRSYTMHDQAFGRCSFKPAEDLPFHEGDYVTLILRKGLR